MKHMIKFVRRITENICTDLWSQHFAYLPGSGQKRLIRILHNDKVDVRPFMDFACHHRTKDENQIGILVFDEQFDESVEFVLQHLFALDGSIQARLLRFHRFRLK